MSGPRAGMGRSRPRALLVAGTACALAWPAGAAALTPIAAQDVATGDFIGRVAAATGPSGQATAIWTGQNNLPTVLAVQRPAGGSPGVAQVLDTEPNASSPNVAYLPDGGALAVWSHSTVGVAGSYAAAPPGGAFERARDFDSGQNAHDLAVDGLGRAFAIWQGFNTGPPTTFQPRFAIWPVGSVRSFSTGLNVAGTTTTAVVPHAAANAAGEIVAVWDRQTAAGPPANFAVQVAFGTTTGLSLSSPASLTAPTTTDDFGSTDVAIGPGGHAAVIWVQAVGAATTVQAAFREPGGAFGAPQDLAGAAGNPAGRPTVAVDAAGTATLAWLEGTGAAAVVREAARPAGGAIGPAQTVSAGGAEVNTDLDLDLDATGAATLAWLRTVGADEALEAARRPAGGQFGAPTTITGQANAFATAVEPGGGVFAAWTAPVSPAVDVLRVGGLDNDAPPTIATLDIPVLAAVGSPAAFAVAASDPSGIGQVTWDFGDGATATGARATHAYSAAGGYTVTVRVADRAGIVATATGRVVVPAAGLPVLLDRTAPRLPVLRTPRRITRTALLRPGLAVTLRADERATARVELLAAYDGRRLVRRPLNLVLASARTILVAGRPRTVRLRPRAALIGGRAFRATVRITVSDPAGNTRMVTRAVSVTLPRRR